MHLCKLWSKLCLMSNAAKPDDELKRAHDALHGWWEAAGVDVPTPQKAPKRNKVKSTASPVAQTPKAAPKAASKPAAPVVTTPPVNAQKTRELAAGAKTLEALKEALEGFDAGPVKSAARNTVFARGNAKASLMVIGEAPGREEDEQGLPFVGQSGQLLDRMLGAAAFSEDDFYITNAFNWRPPQNRKPTPDELAMTLPFLERHIALIDPKIILLVGASPMQAVLGLKSGITRARGQWHDYTIKNPDGSDSKKTVPALPTFHPAFLLRAPLAKRDVWHDLQSVRERLGEIDLK